MQHAPTPLYREQAHSAALPPALGSGVSWAIIATSVLSNTLFAGYVYLLVKPFFAMRSGRGMHDDMRITLAVGFLYVGFLVLHAVLAAVWTYRAWSWLPPELRFRRGAMRWEPISPAKAAGFLFIPYFNLYWVFVITRVLTDSLERMRPSFPSSRPIVPHQLGMIASICTIVFTVAVQIPIVMVVPWILFIRRFEAVTRDFANERFPRAYPPAG